MYSFFKLTPTVIALSIICAGTLQPQICFADNGTYASLPPFISADTDANVLFVTDFSGSMQGQAYYDYNYSFGDGYSSAQVVDFGDKGEVSTNYDSSTTYYGYFDSTKYYSYNSGQEYWEIDTGTSFTAPQVGNKDSLSGNFLNFLVTTRVDAVLKNLIGGKAECPTGESYCILKPQGARRWVEVDNLNANCYVRPESWDSGSYLTKDILISVENVDGTSSIGEFTDRYARVKIDADDRSGIIQKNFSKMRFGFIAYATTSNDTAEEGMIKYGVHENDMDALMSAIENTIPYDGTHTGEALREAYYYLTQSSSAASYNTGYIAEGTEKDPYYEKRTDGTLEPAWCRKSYVILISDGEYNGSIDPDTWAQKLHIEDLRETDGGGKKDKFPEEQNANVYSLFAFSSDINGQESMKTVAAFGNYEDISGGTDGTPYTFLETTDSEDNSFPRTNCNPSGIYNDACEEWDSDKDGVPDAFYYASDGQAMSDALTAIFEALRQGTASGSAVTALTSRVSTGNVVAQAAFFPEKEFDDGKKVTWIGDVFGEWYLNGYIPNASSVDTLVQNIREDTNNDYSLQVKDDRIIEYVINNKDLTINAYDSNEYGTKLDTTVDKVYDSIEEINNLFDCGEQLRTREPDDRTIYGVDENDELTEFTVDNKDEFDTLLGDSATEYPDCLLTSGAPDYEKLIKYTRGEPVTSCRSRATNNSATDENVWKIGDIIYSSPTIVEYDDYALVYTGSNNGMLHAFHMGFIKNIGQTLNPAKLCDDSSASTCTHTSIGKEAWAFVPKDAMPYLRYMASPDYDHIYAVDLKPYIVNMGSRVILIGGMRFGGGTDATDADAINPPSDTGTVGRSAYYALDITKPLNPKYLWRYAPDGMGFSYSGPAYVKRKDSDGSWHYFVMFASGPTTYEGRSTQDLQIFTVDLFTGEEKDVFGDKSNELGINNAFGGRLFTNGIDINEDGQTDFIFLGFTENADGAYSKMKGGIIKIWTGSDDPLDWDYDKTFLGFNANPITAPIKVMDCFPDQLAFPFLYFGTGRYFVSNDETQDTNGDVNYLYGVPFNYGADNTPIKGASSINSSSNASALTCETLDKINTNPLQAAWHIPLEEAGGNYLRERCYSDPSITEYNIVFFDTARPTDVVCECGGQARSWVVNCASGMAIDDVICTGTDKYVVDEKVQFTYLIQRSGGDIQQYGEDEFTENNKRTTAWGEGVPSEQGGLPTFPSGSMLGTILYWKQW
jgi:type IV pilus assembly protein PilY1